MQHSIIRIARKEISTFFSSPIAFIFLGAFLLITLFTFFWVETFFARNIADVRPLFEWMPILLIFLVAALTMRMWSEEQRMGTLEYLLTQPVKPVHYVLGKFLGCLTLVAIALLLTLPLPITVSLLGNLDWGPVWGGYIATLFLAGAYIAIGLTVSARTDNQIVSLIVTVLICSLFYLLGSSVLTSLLGNQAGEFFQLLGSGSRFTSITRGVIDLRDLVYYFSIIGIFLTLNVYFLESGRWTKNVKTETHTKWRLITLLLTANFIAGNIWLQKVGFARADVTEGQIYSISNATENYLQQLREPLLIRGYFSAKTHPLLAPMVPQLRDLILEYEIAGKGKVRAEFIDPLENPELEEEAAGKYGIKPVPFQIADKYQASLVNSYFDILIQYGDKHQVLSFRDLIEVKSQTEGDLDIQLRNPEYEITRSIKKVLYEYQSGGDIFENIDSPVTFKGFISPDEKLPDVLVKFSQEMKEMLKEIQTESAGKFSYQIDDPEANGGVLAQQIIEEYGFQPLRAGLLDPNSFYFYMLLESGDQLFQVPLPETMEPGELRSSIDAALMRLASGFMKTVAVYTPPDKQPTPEMQQFRMPSGKHFRFLQEKLAENHAVTDADMENGTLSEATDILVVVAPDNLSEKQVFAMDQFLMKGGTVILATAPFSDSLAGGNLSVAKHESGLKEWLQHHGVSLAETLVLDPQNAMLPIPISRDLGGFKVQEVRMVEYPYFVDIRGDNLTGGGDIVGGLPQIMVNWASPINVDTEKNNQRKVTTLLKSSSKSWTSDSTQVIPDFQAYGTYGFKPEDQRASYPLAVVIEGSFQSYFTGKDSPLLSETKPEEEAKQEPDESSDDSTVVSSVIEKSPDSSRLILFSSNEFVTDETLRLAASAGGTLYMNSLDLIENAIDWSVEDRGLLSIRSRSHFSRTLNPASAETQMFWEYINYFLALLGLIVVYLIYRYTRRKSLARFRTLIGEGEFNR